jgi:UDP-N-acetylglucosamine--N-acetylmuramyl-(pentapeptide) pyrophosphoryl-undecaprenol N-acetylglucosamine transferase
VRVVVAGGGSAGHIEPALAFADALRRRHADAEVTALGTERGLDSTLIPARGYPLELIPPVPVPRKLSAVPELLRVPGRLRGAVRAVADVLRDRDAEAVVGFGGYVAAPAYLAARRLRLPIVVHEANPRPGWANKLGAALTPYVATTWPGTPLRGARLIGLPIRESIATLDRSARRAEARAHFGLDPDRPTLLVFGGSQGARRLNLAVAAAAEALAAAGVQVLHATGPAQTVELSRPAGGPPYVLVPYLDRMDLAYAAADLALCRAGANTVTELTALGLPAAYVPLPIGNGEQELIAAPVVAAGGGLLVRDADCTPDWVRARLVSMLLDRERLATMSSAARATGRPDAADRLVDLVELAMAGPAERNRT